MIQSGERLNARPSLTARSVASIWEKVALLRAEACLGSAEMTRASLAILAIAAQTLVLYSPGHFRPAGSGIFASIVTLGTLLSLALCFGAGLDVKSLLG